MNRLLTISAIAMFAVVLGMSSITPAMAKADTPICHYAETEFLTDPDTGVVITDPDNNDEPIVLEAAHWKVITVNSKGATKGHVEHHGPVDDQTLKDFEIDESEGSGKTSGDCTNRNNSPG